MQTHVLTEARAVALSTSVVWFMSLAAALGTASIYPLQPAIADVAVSTHASLATVGVALACGLREAWPRRSLRAPIVAAAALSVATQASLTFFVDSPYYQQVVNLGSEADPRPWSIATYPLVARVRWLGLARSDLP